jgi:hypothetical protein
MKSTFLRCAGFLGICFGLYMSPATCQENTRDVPLETITTTSYQKGLHHTTQGNWLLQIYEKGSGLGASNIFLVDAPEFDSAVEATASLFLGGHSADRAVLLDKPNTPKGNHWLVAYLGIAGMASPAWLVDAATVESNTIRFTYHRDKEGGRSRDSWQYFYWVPLKKLPDGVYQLELFDSDAKAVTLSRRVIVGK